MALLDLSNRIKDFVAYTKMSVRKFAIECGLKQPTLDKHIRGTAEPNVATLIGIAKRFPELSLDWLLLGEGEMFKGKSDLDAITDKNTERLMKLVDTITTLQDTINAQASTITMLQERNKQLENQLKNKYT